ncbi:hypothetical protein TTHERM_00147650 (macronuclear) [Tetrahymena thermophila SB210]|uniref:Uncharacterized protein n=1 Tax=Tetrahymena thermophila (strain SB210) TaxID=312017 RepID=I7ML64_TETTS|nr:hypothetical protein TTHERM_00147650 [Tetrahymena thermophila SB210]EAS01254.2 hypothetical protein TTHERM_00147650 [Tetrahymena thermophila SB210]|eukprot:XP_001021499.2 hypothetical protein TTHERM_00147650 [Tetrahymena thermophila SB210]
MEKACDLLKERLAGIKQFLDLSSQDDLDSNKKLISSCVVKMKRQEKIRAQKENEILEALFTFKSASKNERINFEKTSYELMVMLSPQFEYQVQDKGFYTDIAEMFIAYYTHINNTNKVEEIKVINQNNIYHNFPFLCMLYKGLVEFSKKIFQEKVKITPQSKADLPLLQKKENSNSISNQRRNENQIEQKLQKPKSQDKQNICLQLNVQTSNQIQDYADSDKNICQQELKEELLSNSHENLKSGEESFRNLNSVNDQKISKPQAIPINLNRKRGSYLSNQCGLNVARSETPENTKFTGGAYSSTNSSQSASASQMFKKYFSSKISNESANEEKKTFLGHQRYYSNYDKEKFLFYQFCVLPPTTIPQANFQGGFSNAYSSITSSIQVNTPINNCIIQKNQILQSNSNNTTISEQQQLIQNSHQQALSCPQFARRNYFRIVKEAVEDAEFMVFKRNELLAMYYYKNIVSRNSNIAKTIDNFRIQHNTKNQNKAEQKITEKLQLNQNKNEGNQFTLPYLNGECSLTTPSNKNQLNKSKGMKIDLNLINNGQKQNDMSQTPEKQQQLLPNITGKSNSKNFSDFLGKRQICTNNQPALNSIQNIQSIYQNANQKSINTINQGRLASQTNQMKKNQNNNKSCSNGIICERNAEISNEKINYQKSELNKKVQISDDNEEKLNSYKINDTEDIDQSFQVQENSKEITDKMMQSEQNNQGEMKFHFNEIKIDIQMKQNSDFQPDNNNQQVDSLKNKNDQIETQDSLKENRQLLDEIEEEENTNRDLNRDIASSSLDKLNQEQQTQYTTPETPGQKPIKQLQQSSTEEKKIAQKLRNLDFLERNLSIGQNNQERFRLETSCSDFKKQKRRQQSKSQHQEIRQNQQVTGANSQQDMNQTIYDKIKICDDLINQEKSIENQYFARLQQDHSIENKQNLNENRNNSISPSNPLKKITASRLQKLDTSMINNSFRSCSKKKQLEHISLSNKENIPIITKSTRNSNIEEGRNLNNQNIGGIFDIKQQFQQQLIEGSLEDKVCKFKQKILGKNKTNDNICSVFVNKSNKSQSRQKQKYIEDLKIEAVTSSNQKEQFIKQLTNKLQEVLTVNKDSIKKIEISKNQNQNDIQNDESVKLPQFKQEKDNGNKVVTNFNKNTPQASQNKKNITANLNTSYEQTDRKKQFSRNQGQNRINEKDQSLNIIKDFQLDQITPIIAPAGSSEYTSLKSKNKQSYRSKSIQDEGINGFNYSKCQDTQTKNIDNIIQSNFTTISQQQYITITNPISQNTSIDVSVNETNKHLINNQVKKQMKQSQIPKTPKINQNLSTRNAQQQQITNNKDEQDNSKYQLLYQQSYAHNAKVSNLKCKEFYNLLFQGQASNSNTSQSTKLQFESNNTSSQQSYITDNKLSIETPYSSSSRYIKRRSLRLTYMAGCGAAAKSFLSTSNNYENKIETDQVLVQQNFHNQTQNVNLAAKSVLPPHFNGFSMQSNNISNQLCQDDSQSFCDNQIRERNSISLNQAINSHNNKNTLISNQESPSSTSFAISNAKKIINKIASEQQNEIVNLQKSQYNKFKSILQDYNLVQKDGKIVQQNQNKLIKSSLE